jgi:hypothetical protein
MFFRWKHYFVCVFWVLGVCGGPLGGRGVTLLLSPAFFVFVWRARWDLGFKSAGV